MSRLACLVLAVTSLTAVAPAFADAPAVTRRINLSSDPLTWPFGGYGGSVSLAVSDHVALRAEADFLDVTDYRITEGDLSAPIYLDRTYHGVFVEPGVVVRHVREAGVDDCNPGITRPDCVPTPYTRWSTQWGPQALLGWHWSADNGVNLAIALGATFDVGSIDSRVSRTPILPNGYLRVGYAF
jgi:hypothetical protein